jgi:hypothetical protein
MLALIVGGIIGALLTPGLREAGIISAFAAKALAAVIGVSVLSPGLTTLLRCLVKCF